MQPNHRVAGLGAAHHQAFTGLNHDSSSTLGLT
jgi:hypothetical protein